MRRAGLRAAVALALLATTSACATQVVSDPLPGYVRIVAVPPQADVPITVWFRDPGGGNLSTVRFEFEAGEPILIVFPSTPGNGALQVNNLACDGQWAIGSQFETDVVLHLQRNECRTELVGSHAVGTVHDDPQTEPIVGGS